MAFSIPLTLGQRGNLFTLQNVEHYRTRTQKRLFSGREVKEFTEFKVSLSNILRTISLFPASSRKSSILNRIVDNIGGVIKNLNIRAKELGTYIGLLQTRSDFNRNYGIWHVKSSDKYTLADINQEGTYLVVLQNKQQLSLNALAVSGRQQNAVLTLFS